MKGGVDDKNKKHKKDKQDKKEKKAHHHHHNTDTKPTGPAPVPPISLNERIVKEMHADPLPSPTSPKLISPIKSPQLVKPEVQPSVPTTPSEQLGVVATLLKWIKENLLHPTFSRQKQISNAYSNQFVQTLTAIQKRFSANDARIEEETLAKSQALRFSSAHEEKSVTVADLSVTTTPKPTLH